jgi:hypothetical protein
LSADGDTLAVGAGGEASNSFGVNGYQVDNTAASSGAVYVYVCDAFGEWSQSAYVKASNTDAGDGFGEELALSGDASTLAISAPNEDGSAMDINGSQGFNNRLDAGAVYLY